MFMAFIMLFTWQATSDQRYQEPFKKSVEAVYTSSELKTNVDIANDRLKQRQPVLTALLPIGYAFGIRKQITYTSSKLTPIPGVSTTYNYNQQVKSGSISMIWRF